nr:MAG: hypothetical protein [Bacteriophage sp.]
MGGGALSPSWRRGVEHSGRGGVWRGVWAAGGVLPTGRAVPIGAARPVQIGGDLPGGGEVCAVAGAISPAAFCPHRPGAAGGASLPYTMQCGRRGGAVARIAPGRVQSPRGGPSSASGRRGLSRSAAISPAGGIAPPRKSRPRKTPRKNRPTENGQQKKR